MNTLRSRLVEIALEWERTFGNAPHITGIVAEYDAAVLLGIDAGDYSKLMQGSTAVQRGHDFIHLDKRYQVKGTRPSGKKGSKITNVPKPRNYDWDYLIWMNYNQNYDVVESWLWKVHEYRNSFEDIKRLSPSDMRKGTQIFPLR